MPNASGEEAFEPASPLSFPLDDSPTAHAEFDGIDSLEYHPVFPEARMPQKPQKQVDWKWLITTILVLVGLVVGATWKIDSKFSDIGSRVDRVDKHLTKIESAVRVIADRQGGDVKGLVDDILVAAKAQQDSGNPNAAANILKALPKIIQPEHTQLSTASVAHAARNLEQFRASSNSSVSEAALKGVVALATYRSASTPVPASSQSMPVRTELSIGTLIVKGGRFFISDSFLSGNAIDNSSGNGFDIDGAVLRNVTLEGVKIVYRGGPVTLDNVHFVNCRFSVSNTPSSDRLLLEAVIQENPSLNIG